MELSYQGNVEYEFLNDQEFEIAECSSCGSYMVNAILVNPNSVSAVVETIEFIITNPEVASRIGKKGRQVAEKHFDY